MKQLIVFFLAAVLVLGPLLASPVSATPTSDEQEEETEEEEQEVESNDDTTEPESEPEPESEAQPLVPEPEPLVEEPEIPVPVPPECKEGEILNEEGTQCIPDPVAMAQVPTTQVQQLPPCDGSAQDCVTPNGDVCLVGQGGHECECAEDMSDCPNHPSLQEPAVAVTETETEAETEEEPIDPCLLDPGHESCPEPVDGVCPEGYNMNEDGQCFPEHEQCPEGYHSHEDDESGKCIPDSTPCDDGYIMNPDFPSCDRKEFVCAEHPTIEGCSSRDDNGDDDDDIDIRIKTVIKNIDIHKTIHNTADFPDVDIIGLSIKDNGDAMVCMMNIDNDWVQCQEFGVPNERIDENIWRVIETDSDKDYDNANTGSDDVDDAINGIKGQDFSELDDIDNHDFNVDLAALAIAPQGDGLICLIEDDRNEGTALCEPFKVDSSVISGQITEIVEFD